MIDAADPLSALIWCVFILAAGMYPLGIILPCSTCCGPGSCPTPIDFLRCVRIEDPDPEEVETTFPAGTSNIPQTMHGWSVPIKRITDIGAHRVATKYAITGRVTVLSANAMSDGETSNAVYKLHLFEQNGSHGKGIGEIRVTLRGVTRPMTWERSYVIGTQYAYLGLYEGPVQWEYDASSNQDSTTATVSAEVVECNVVSGAEWLSGSTATASALRSMMTVAVIPRHYIYIGFRAVFTATSSLFNYVPATKSVELEYVIRHSRGGLHLYKRLRVMVYKYATGTITEIPSGGLPPLSLPPAGQYADSTVGTCSTTYGEDPASTPAYPIKTVELCSLQAGQTIVMPTIEYGMTGDDFLKRGFSCEVTPGNHLSGSFFGSTNAWLWPSSSQYGEADWEFALDDYVQASDLKYIMRFQIPDGTNRIATEWNFDHDEVASFLNGEPLEIEMGGYYDYYNIYAPPTPAIVVRRITISASNRYCGAALCAAGVVEGSTLWDAYPYGQYTNFKISQVVPETVTYTSALPRATWTGNNSQGVNVQVTNYCTGSDEPYVVAMRKTPGGTYNSCGYYGTLATCDGVNAARANAFVQYGDETGASGASPSADARWFFCGDLLWAIENGPCRETITIEGRLYEAGGFSSGTYELGGDDNASATGPRCAVGWPTKGVCPPADMTVSVPGGDVYDLRCNKIGTFDGGDVVCQPSTVTCTAEIYVGTAPFSARVPGYIGFGSLQVFAGRRRTNWCSPWQLAGSLESNNSGAGWNFVVSGGFLSGSGGCVPTSCTDGRGNIYALPGVAGSFTICTTLSLGEIGDPSEDTTATADPQEKTIPAEGESFSVDFCCPEITRQYTVGENNSRYDRYFPVVPKGATAYGATAYVTQEGKGDSYCPFDIAWHRLYFSGEEPQQPWSPLVAPTVRSYSDGQMWQLHGYVGSPIYIRKQCPLYGAVWHLESPPCEWTISRTGNWFTAEKTEDGLIKVLATEDPPTPTTEGTITITSGDNTQTVQVKIWGS